MAAQLEWRRCNKQAMHHMLVPHRARSKSGSAKKGYRKSGSGTASGAANGNDAAAAAPHTSTARGPDIKSLIKEQHKAANKKA
jgi:hypothetical protein